MSSISASGADREDMLDVPDPWPSMSAKPYQPLLGARTERLQVSFLVFEGITFAGKLLFRLLTHSGNQVPFTTAGLVAVDRGLALKARTLCRVVVRSLQLEVVPKRERGEKEA